MYNKQMKSFIERAIQLDIENLATRNGYNNADILTVTSYNKKHIEMLKVFAKMFVKEVKMLKKEANVFNNLKSDLYSLHCVFSEDKHDNEVFQLKHTI